MTRMIENPMVNDRYWFPYEQPAFSEDRTCWCGRRKAGYQEMCPACLAEDEQDENEMEETA